jgi:hypothetical protein
MRPIRQTWFGSFLCWLGVHALVTTGHNTDQDGYPSSTWGGCVRCNRGWQWDN